MPEEDDESGDVGYKMVMRKRNTQANVKEVTTWLHQSCKLDTVYRLARQDHNKIIQDTVVFDEPPYRYLFSSLGLSPTTNLPHAVRFMVLDKHSTLTADDGTTFSAFDALQALRVRFANKPSDYDGTKLCGTSNCFEASVPTNGQEAWSIALRTVLLAIDAGTHGPKRWQGGATLPTTVSVRAPKASKFEDKSGDNGWVHAKNARDELALTLSAAKKQLCPPVYAAIPVKIFSEPLKTVYSRDVAYVFESGWLNLADLIKNLSGVHQDPDELAEAKKNVVRSTNLILEELSYNKKSGSGGWFFMDAKPANMVARRRPNTTEYEVRFIDFSALWTIDANRHCENLNSSDNVYFINGLLFLNYIEAIHPHRMAMFKPLAESVMDVWYAMDVKDGSLCALLKQDQARVPEEAWPYAVTLSRTKTLSEHHTLLRAAFYRMIDNYGENGRLLKKADPSTPSGPSFLKRFVDVVEEAYTNAA